MKVYKNSFILFLIWLVIEKINLEYISSNNWFLNNIEELQNNETNSNLFLILYN